tara:strand:+ start:11587 stop:11697 length:111 start_codon:yes stop_codon:yes gene_type:complete
MAVRFAEIAATETDILPWAKKDQSNALPIILLHLSI